ncbi:MAG: hypothetical protein KI790_14845 [Cyclobacteriaceae bacterium]|nr:hypothetical protein [Cyclobacteriaceae bacterium HetDA_MAG_MS6]
MTDRKEIFQEEVLALTEFRTLISSGQQISRSDLIAFADQFEDLVEVSKVALKIVDRLVAKQQAQL